MHPCINRAFDDGIAFGVEIGKIQMAVAICYLGHVTSIRLMLGARGAVFYFEQRIQDHGHRVKVYGPPMTQSRR